MLWGNFGIVHLASILVAVLLNVGLYFILKRFSRRTQIAVLALLSLSGIAAIIFNLVSWGSPLQYLPLHLCSLNALVLPFAVLTRNKTLCNLLLLWSAGAFFALVINHSASNFEIFSWTFAFYYFPHIFEAGIPIILFKLKLTKLSKSRIPSTIVITMLSYTLVHFINLIVNSFCIRNNIVDYAGNVIQVNYMFSITPDNPLLRILYGIIPHSYWYMYGIIPIVAVYLGAIYFLHHFYSRRRISEPEMLTSYAQ